MYDKKERKPLLKTHRNPIVKRLSFDCIPTGIKKRFATIFFLCQTLGIIRISTQASTTFKLKSPALGQARIVNTTSTITWSGYLNIVNLFSEVV